jgi:ribosomal protein S10
MLLDAVAGKFHGSEKERVWNRYWTYHSGSIIPSWLNVFVSEDALWIYHDRIFYRREHCAWSEGWFYLGCAIELEHRAAPARTLGQLRRLVAKARRPGYDFTAAKLLDEEVTHLQSLHTREINVQAERWQAELHHRMLDAHPDKMKLIHAIETMKLPQGAAANLALMRAIVGAEKK